MPFVRNRNVVDNLDRLNFAFYKSFPTAAIKTSPNFITYHQITRDVKVWYKQCMMQKLCTLVLTLKGYLGIWYSEALHFMYISHESFSNSHESRICYWVTGVFVWLRQLAAKCRVLPALVSMYDRPKESAR